MKIPVAVSVWLPTVTPLPNSAWNLLAHGLWYSATILAILGCHELGHYLACRYYDVDASLPFFIPAPFVMTGTLGAVIRIREAFPTRKALFDIGIAGPIGGFLVVVPFLIWGVVLSSVGGIITVAAKTAGIAGSSVPRASLIPGGYLRQNADSFVRHHQARCR